MVTLENMGVEVMEADTCNPEYSEIGNHEVINFNGQYSQIQTTTPPSRTALNNAEYSEIPSYSACSVNRAHASTTSAGPQALTPSAVCSQVVKTTSKNVKRNLGKEIYTTVESTA